MNRATTLDELARRLVGMIPRDLHETQRDMEQNLRATLNSTFAKLNLVTREEFDVQTEVLSRTRAKLKTLEDKVAALESEFLKPRTKE